jgi:alpha-N-arabinofuranosidase
LAVFWFRIFEYFQLSEDLGAEPLPILSCGMACQFNTAELVKMEDLNPYVQDALDLIEFANGDITRLGEK